MLRILRNIRITFLIAKQKKLLNNCYESQRKWENFLFLSKKELSKNENRKMQD